MSAPRVFLAYSPRGVGVECALVYAKEGKDAYGWYTGPREGRLASAYFLLEGFYVVSEPAFLAAAGADPYAGWTHDYTDTGGAAQLDPPVRIDDALCHAMVRLQDAFVHEWLFYRAGNAAQAEIALYGEAELAVGEVNIRFRRLNKFSRLQPTWTYYSLECEHSMLAFMMRRWPLDYRSED
ncbi:MAG TPA: hypothetical protein VLX30_05695 [Burkholderiales bacterium]|nr:hypothetical protein [Burkholderiales bacterium]